MTTNMFVIDNIVNNLAKADKKTGVKSTRLVVKKVLGLQRESLNKTNKTFKE